MVVKIVHAQINQSFRGTLVKVIWRFVVRIIAIMATFGILRRAYPLPVDTLEPMIFLFPRWDKYGYGRTVPRKVFHLIPHVLSSNSIILSRKLSTMVSANGFFWFFIMLVNHSWNPLSFSDENDSMFNRLPLETSTNH